MIICKPESPNNLIDAGSENYHSDAGHWEGSVLKRTGVFSISSVTFQSILRMSEGLVAHSVSRLNTE